MKMFTMKLPNGEVWGVPVQMIAENRAEYYKDEFGDDLQRSLAEDTLPYFERSPDEIYDWAVNNMNWSDFDGHQVKVSEAPALRSKDFIEAWNSGEKSIEDMP